MIKSIKIGNIAEKLLIDTLVGYGFEAYKNTDKESRSFFDVIAKITGQTFTFEVKHDVMASKTGNLAIEYYNSKSNKDSGINITRADYWVHIINNKQNEEEKIILISRVSELKQFIKNNKPKRKIVGAGDKNADILLFTQESMTCFQPISHLYFI